MCERFDPVFLNLNYRYLYLVCERREMYELYSQTCFSGFCILVLLTAAQVFLSYNV